MTPVTPSAVVQQDAELVARSRAGDRDAFGQIVARYQSLVCALAFSATGSRARSEDLAQETFVAAWRQLAQLREPARLGAWLCGIARHLVHGDRRHLQREPVHAAESLDDAMHLAGPEPLPPAQAVTNEEIALLWREIGRLPEGYREPLVLYYRQHQSIEQVASALELTPDAAMQRVSRGRRLLQERMVVFIESTLARTNPGPQFSLQVQAALPLVVAAGPATAATASPAGVAAKGGALAFVFAFAAPLVGTFAAIGATWMDIVQAPTRQERRLVAGWTLALWLTVAALVIAMPLVSWYADRAGLHHRQDWTATAPYIALWFVFAMTALTIIVLMNRARSSLRRRLAAEGSARGATALRPPRWRRMVNLFAILTAVFWILIYVAAITGDRVVAAAIAMGVIVATPVPFALERTPPTTPDAERARGGWFVAGCGVVFLLILNLRLDVWAAAMYATDLATARRLLPMPLIHALSVIGAGWTALLVLVTRPRRAHA